jgi:hypothetical protein
MALRRQNHRDLIRQGRKVLNITGDESAGGQGHARAWMASRAPQDGSLVQRVNITVPVRWAAGGGGRL